MTVSSPSCLAITFGLIANLLLKSICQLLTCCVLFNCLLEAAQIFKAPRVVEMVAWYVACQSGDAIEMVTQHGPVFYV